MFIAFTVWQVPCRMLHVHYVIHPPTNAGRFVLLLAPIEYEVIEVWRLNK